MANDPRSGFTDKRHLTSYAYSDVQRLKDRAAVYQHLNIVSVDIGTHPFRGEGLVGLVSTFLDPEITGPALDIGCGAGQYLPLLASQCASVIGADLSAGMLAGIAPGPWTTQLADVETLPFADATFQVILANHMLYHCPNVALAVSEIRRVLRSGGVLIATTNGDGNFSEAYDMLAAAAGAVLGREVAPLTPADARFTLETGSVALAKSFASVSTKATIGFLVFPSLESLETLRAYFRSVDDEWSGRYGIDWPTLESALNREIMRRFDTDGEVRISTASGTLIATEPRPIP